jgi:peptide/nickel transport system permease protein
MRWPRALRGGRARSGLGILGVVLGIALVGPLFAPHSPSALIGAPAAPPGNGHLLGTDSLGRDVLSRVLWGGRSVIWLALVTTGLACAAGLTVGLIAGYTRSIMETLLMRTVDVVLAFPPLLFFMLVATNVGNGTLVVVVGVAIVLAPGIARVVYSATREVSVCGYVEAAVVRGETTFAILRRDLLPNILGPVIANFGLTLTYSVLLIAAVNFLGLGLQPPAANWALMVSENRAVVGLNVWATVAPALLIVMLTVGVNLVGDSVAHSLGRSDLSVAAEVMAAPGLMEETLVGEHGEPARG